MWTFPKLDGKRVRRRTKSLSLTGEQMSQSRELNRLKSGYYDNPTSVGRRGEQWDDAGTIDDEELQIREG